MPLEIYFCERCTEKLTPTEEVVHAIEQVEATTFGDEHRHHIDGVDAFFHLGHFPGPSSYREIGHGPLNTFRPNAS